MPYTFVLRSWLARAITLARYLAGTAMRRLRKNDGLVAAPITFPVDVMDYDVLNLVTRFLAITGTEPWSRKRAALRRQLQENEYLRDWQAEYFGIELKLLELLEEQQRTGQFPIHVRDHMHYKLYGFVAGIVRIHERLSSRGQNRLRGMLRDGLQPDNNLLSLQHEVLTAVHLVSRGYLIVLNDLEGNGGVDFIALRDGLEVEVECKMFTGDIGRQIHRRKALDLQKRLSEALKIIYNRAEAGISLRITLPARLTCRPEQIRGVTAAVTDAMESPTSRVKTPHCEVEVVRFEIADSPFTVSDPRAVMKAVPSFVEKQLGRTNRELMVMFAPGKRAIVVLVESAKSDEVLKGVYRQLREAAKGQFTKCRPGILSVQFQDLTAEQMESIAKANTTDAQGATGLQLMTTYFLSKVNRAHIHTVSYRSHGILVSQESSGANTIQEGGLAYFVRNPLNSFYADQRVRAFAHEGGK